VIYGRDVGVRGGCCLRQEEPRSKKKRGGL
jgi:hypothetical protein